MSRAVQLRMKDTWKELGACRPSSCRRQPVFRHERRKYTLHRRRGRRVKQETHLHHSHTHRLPHAPHSWRIASRSLGMPGTASVRLSRPGRPGGACRGVPRQRNGRRRDDVAPVWDLLPLQRVINLASASHLSQTVSHLTTSPRTHYLRVFLYKQHHVLFDASQLVRDVPPAVHDAHGPARAYPGACCGDSDGRHVATALCCIFCMYPHKMLSLCDFDLGLQQRSSVETSRSAMEISRPSDAWSSRISLS